MRIIAFTMTLLLGVYAASFFYTVPAVTPSCSNVNSYTHRAAVVSGEGIKAIPLKFDTSQN